MPIKNKFFFVSDEMCLYRATLDRAGLKGALLKFPAFCYAFTCNATKPEITCNVKITCNATKPEEKLKKYFSKVICAFL